MKVAVVGAGTAGLMAAWLLEESAEVVCFESSDDVGGNGRNSLIDLDGAVVETSLRPDVLLPQAYPLTMTMLRLLGVPTVKAPASMVVLDDVDNVFFRASAFAPLNPSYLVDSSSRRQNRDWLYLLKSLRRLRASGDHAVLWKEFVAGLALSPEFIHSVATPVAASILGIDYATLGRVSAGAALEQPVRQLPTLRHGYASPRIVVSGVGRWLEQLGASLRSARIRYQTAVHTVAPSGGRVVVSHAAGEDEFDAVILAVPPWVAAPLLTGLRSSLLEEIESTETQVSLIQRSRSQGDDPHFASSTVVVCGDADAALEAKVAAEGASELWRSWAVPGTSSRGQSLLSLRCRHLLPTPASLSGLSRAGELQGRDGIYLAGGTSTGWDCEEGGVVSAVTIAYELAPKSPRLSLLIGAMAARRGTRASVAPLP